MKTKTEKVVVTFGLLAVLSVGASAQQFKCPGGANGAKCGGGTSGKVEIHSLDNTVRAEEDQEIELVHGSSLDEKISAQGKKLVLQKKEAVCNDEDYEADVKEKELDFDPESGKISEKDTDPDAKLYLKLKYIKAKAASGKSCLKDAMIALKKKMAAAEDYSDKVKVKYVGGSAGLDGEKAKLELIIKKKLAAAKAAKVKLDTDGGVKAKVLDSGNDD